MKLTRDEIASDWSDDELRKQLELVLWEHKSIPNGRRDDRNHDYRSVMNWYSTVCEEFRRRGMNEELEFRVYEYRTGQKPPQ